jgi:tetratricopeptide (TPR) repeat protein
MSRLPESLSDKEKEDVRESCYELLLVLAAAVEQPADGLRLLDAAAHLLPPTPAYHLGRALCYSRAGDAEAARRERQAAGRLEPSNPLDLFLLGKEAYRQKDWRAGVRLFDAALLVRPEHFWSHCLAAICRLQLREPVAAKTELTACVQIHRDFAWLHVLRGFASYQVAVLARQAANSLPSGGTMLRDEAQAQLKASETDYKRAVDLLNEKPNEHVRYALLVDRGLLWLERHDWDKAAADFQSAIRVDERQYLAYANLAEAREGQNRPAEAIAEFTRAIALEPGLPELFRGRAAIELKRKASNAAQRARALHDLDQAIGLENPANRVLAADQTDRARLLAREDRDEQALAACDAALLVDRDFAPAHEMRLKLLRKLKRYDELIASCDILLARGRPSADFYELRGLAREKQGTHTAAIEDFTQALALKPASAPLLIQRGELYLITDAPRSAQRDFDEAIRLDSSSADAYAGRGLAVVALGHYSDAVADAATALRLAEPTTRRLYNAARIHAKAAIAATNDVRRKGQDALALVNRYQDQAVALVGQALKRQPASQRAAFLRDVVPSDPALKTLRRRLQSLAPLQGG